MAKKFAPRVSKKSRKKISFDKSLYKNFDEGLLADAQLEELKLKDINVKEQVRTKFNEASIRELGQNIKTNGLIQPLVVHLSKGVYTLICGERRYRAMTLIEKESAPCFVLRDKSSNELMAIQFSENSSREALHYIDKAEGILNYQKATKASERKICAALGISKSEVHRSLLIAKMPVKIREAAKLHDIEKYVLIEFDSLDKGAFRKKIERQILIGEVKKRADLRKLIKAGGVVTAKKGRTRKKTASLPRGLTANALLKVMESKTKSLDAQTKKALQALLEETRETLE